MRKKYRSFLLVAVMALFISATVHAQADITNPFPGDVIKIDPVTRKPEKAIPFDRPFALVVAMEDVEAVETVFAYEVLYRKKNKGDSDFLNLMKGTYKPDSEKSWVQKLIEGQKIRDIHSVPINGISIRKDSKQKLLIIGFPSLPPNFHFDFAIRKKLDGATLKAIRKFTDAIADSLIWGNQVKGSKLIREFDSFQKGIDKLVYPGQARAFLSDDLAFSGDCCAENPPEKNCANAEFSSRNLYCYYKIHRLDTVYQQLHDFDFGIVTPQSQDVAGINQLFLAEKLDSRYMVFLDRVGVNSAAYASGMLSSKQFKGDEETKFFDFEQRLANLDTTIAYLRATRLNLEELRLRRPGDRMAIDALQKVVSDMILKIGKNRKELADIAKLIADELAGDAYLQYTDWYLSTNEVRDLQTKSASIFTPQIGLSLLMTRKIDNSMNYIPKINWGVNINFRQIDKQIRRRYLQNPTLWHYLSLYVGLTIGGFRDKEYENLYSNTSLMVGPSYRINRVLYFSGGMSLYRQKDSNPLINKFKITPGGYVSVLLDLDITNAVSAIRNTLFK